MAEILIKAIDANHTDPEKDREGCYKKGYPVEVRADGSNYGRKECPPLFVIFKIPDATVEEVRSYCNMWMKQIDYEVLSSNPTNGTYQIRVYGQNVSNTGQNILTREQIETFLNRWNAVVDSVSANEVVFTFNLWNAVRSNGFWEVDVLFLIFTLNSYVPATGIASIDVENYIEQGYTDEQVQQRIEERGGTVVSQDAGVTRFTIERSDILTRFRQEVKEREDKVYCRRQYYFPVLDIDAALANGGVLTLTKAEALGKLLNKLDE